MRLAALFAVAFAASALSACAAPVVAPTTAGAVQMRVLVKLARPSQDATAIAAEATHSAGVSASYASAVSATWHSLVLHCPDAPACDAAMLRLRQASAIYEAVELDGRKQRAVM